jgi:hypothetical protein
MFGAGRGAVPPQLHLGYDNRPSLIWQSTSRARNRLASPAEPVHLGRQHHPAARQVHRRWQVLALGLGHAAWRGFADLADDASRPLDRACKRDMIGQRRSAGRISPVSAKFWQGSSRPCISGISSTWRNGTCCFRHLVPFAARSSRWPPRPLRGCRPGGYVSVRCLMRVRRCTLTDQSTSRPQRPPPRPPRRRRIHSLRLLAPRIAVAAHIYERTLQVGEPVVQPLLGQRSESAQFGIG